MTGKIPVCGGQSCSMKNSEEEAKKDSELDRSVFTCFSLTHSLFLSLSLTPSALRTSQYVYSTRRPESPSEPLWLAAAISKAKLPIARIAFTGRLPAGSGVTKAGMFPVLSII